MEWKTIEDWPLYSISIDGQVKNQKTGRILKGAVNSSGYLYVNLVNGYLSKAQAVHRIVMKHFGEDQPENYIVDHIDGNKTNNKLENLQWLSIRHNTEKYYGNFEKKKLIVELYKQKKSVKEICAEVQLGHCTVRKTIAEYNITI